MPRTCTICSHPQRPEIDAALLNDEPYRSIAKRYGASASALLRHREHLPAFLVKAHDAAETASAGTLLDRLREITRETREVLRSAKDTAAPELALKAITRLEKQLELEGKLLGELSDASIVNVYTSPEWLVLRAAVLTALTPHPDAARAVSEALSDPS